MIKQFFIGLFFIGKTILGFSSLISDSGQLITVPVVVHVVYNTTVQNISDTQIESQISVLNEDYRRLNSDANKTPTEFLSVATDCGIEFQLAKFTPQGSPTQGITRTTTNKTQFANDQITDSESGGADTWGTNYLNIWVANLPDGLAGWANDNSLDSLKQGIIIDYEYFGTTGAAKIPYDLGRTTTHEIGHWLGLSHLEGPLGGCSNDDGIDDTPNQENALTGSITSNSSCGTNDMASNFMQLVDDEHMNLFTQGQKDVMRKTLFESYQELLQNVSRTVGLKSRLSQLLSITPNPINKGAIFKINQSIPSDAAIELFTFAGQNVSNQLIKVSPTEFKISPELVSGIYIFVSYFDHIHYTTKLNISN